MSSVMCFFLSFATICSKTCTRGVTQGQLVKVDASSDVLKSLAENSLL